MEIPVLPVRPGTGVILQCKKKNGEISYFFMNGRLVGPGSTSEYNIRRAQQSDEGLYWCATDTFGESPQSFLRVRGQNNDITSCLKTWPPQLTPLPVSSFLLQGLLQRLLKHPSLLRPILPPLLLLLFLPSVVCSPV